MQWRCTSETQSAQLKLQNKINEINKIKLLELQNRSTLDHFVIAKNKKNTKYPYCTIKGSNQNLSAAKNKLLLTDEDIYLDILVLSQSNFNKKIKEILGCHYIREKLHTYTRDKCTTCRQLVGDIHHYDIDDPDFDKDEDYTTFTARNFQIVNMKPDDFFEAVKNIDESRFN